ncbi:phosphoribosylglycinamide formyltransferase [Brachyspira pilosicoli]|uniref:Phosphoribosylglycinamide formyltransferase n=2 Tax=Brachyspira pilosicoli TaxID=52584 RepID=A0A3B6VM59_BRAPL|nr:phosphoribosylglycinamide formyltransferase [Brachyspira pilosicoli]AGA67011.1 phosphoribosylglycinamide formyltransferase [Brachyspira pilosicoli P43/6/78]MBW5378015.1 phosphoribosylglycinamide formyltransferase [Brachyspira pilosicoli]MBW5382005.1 phosphoribosylglycinamide formyltransferase [Brachyspira pilosicoli]MBW5392211.1 phosphoribosylglycinamide formyltransferase [Brachyspira pilosicoli]MBW5400203.1 phosphoribosylglycinamide formyltransferase [Brachyspira pilosicoli]
MFNIAVLISGGGSNLKSLIDNQKEYYKINVVIADRDCGGLNIAREANIDAVLIDRKEYREKLSKKIDEELKKYNIDLIVLAGYLSIVDSNFISKWKNKIINIHPSLLPKFGGKGMYGMKVHEAVIKNKEKESGCTVHYVTEMVDGGDIIMQNKVDVLEDDTPEILQKRVLVEEHKILPATVIKLASQSHANK